MTGGRLTVRARYLFPGNNAPLRDACLSIEAGRIVAISSTCAPDAIDLGSVAILPGLVNAHTHLEFSSLEAPLGTPEMAFPDWIRRVITWRGEQHRAPLTSDRWRNEAIRAGIHESTLAGATTIGEIATLPVDPLDRYEGFHGTAFLELLGLRDEMQNTLIAAAERFAAAFRAAPGARPGLSPHSPYTVSPQLLDRVVKLSERERLSVAMHLAETRDELELLRDADGSLVDLLRDLDAWQASAIPLATRPMHYLESLAQAHRALVIHGNYLERDEIAFLARHRDRMSVVYCPRTHAYFGHEPYPLAEMLEAGVRVAIGTDSRASNPDLSLLSELRFVARTHPRVAPSEILRMGTYHAAAALGQNGRVGSLAVGKDADFAVLPIGDETPDDPYDLLLASDARTSAVFRAGVPAHLAPDASGS